MSVFIQTMMVNPMALMKHQYGSIQHNKQITYIFQRKQNTLANINSL